MTINIDGKTYYGTSEICDKAGISRSTLNRWIKAGILEKYYEDRRGWRIFTETDLEKIMANARKIVVKYSLIAISNATTKK